MTDCCTWQISSLKPLSLHFLPVPHFATCKTQPVYVQPSHPMWRCAPTARVLMSNHQAFCHHTYWGLTATWLMEFQLWWGHSGLSRWAKHVVVLCQRFSCMTAHVDQESPLWHHTGMHESHRSRNLDGDRQPHEWRCLYICAISPTINN